MANTGGNIIIEISITTRAGFAFDTGRSFREYRNTALSARTLYNKKLFSFKNDLFLLRKK
jgi:hypothetical protein